MTINGRRLAVSLLVMLFVIYALIMFSIAWFSGDRIVTASGRNVDVINGSSTHFSLYEWVGESEIDGQWVAVTQANFTDCVPNEVRRFMVIAKDINVAKVNFLFFNEVTVGNTGNESLFDYIYIKKISESSTAVTVDPQTFAVTYDYGTDDPTYFRYTDQTGAGSVSSSSYSLNCSSKAVIFDFYLSKDVCNHFEAWGFSGTVEID